MRAARPRRHGWTTGRRSPARLVVPAIEEPVFRPPRHTRAAPFLFAELSPRPAPSPASRHRTTRHPHDRRRDHDAHQHGTAGSCLHMAPCCLSYPAGSCGHPALLMSVITSAGRHRRRRAGRRRGVVPRRRAPAPFGLLPALREQRLRRRRRSAICSTCGSGIAFSDDYLDPGAWLCGGGCVDLLRHVVLALTTVCHINAGARGGGQAHRGRCATLATPACPGTLQEFLLTPQAQGPARRPVRVTAVCESACWAGYVEAA